ncbi:MAG: hypothetical protein K2F74_04830, partial [Muribaculaceae bacterium]|nr:hypothetical protein [Muribaculaceae bacterium]
IIKLEDFTGTGEIVFFSRQMLDYRKFGQEGLAILVRGIYKLNARGEIRFNIGTIQLLEEVKGTMIGGLTLTLPIDALKGDAMTIICDRMKAENKHSEKINTEKSIEGKLNLCIFDPEINRSVNLASGLRIALDRKLMEDLDSIPDITYKVQPA